MASRTAYRWLLATACLVVVVGLLLPHAPWPVPLALPLVLAVTGGVLGFAALLAWRMPDACDEAPLALRRRYVREFFPAMGAYALAVFASAWLLKRVDEPALRALLALLPIPPVALALRSIMRYIRDVDELQQRIELEAVSFATALVSLVYLAGGFLQSAKVVDLRASTAMLMVFPLVCGIYGVAKMVVARRFR